MESLVEGMTIKFERSIFTKSWRRPEFSHKETYICLIKKESYGKEKGQHTFTLKILEQISKNCERAVGKTIRVKGRNLYPNCKVIEFGKNYDENCDKKEGKKLQKCLICGEMILKNLTACPNCFTII